MLSNNDVDFLILLLKNHGQRRVKLFGYNHRLNQFEESLERRLMRIYNTENVRVMK